MNRVRSIAAFAALSLAVSACGGHGGSGGTLPADPGSTFTGSVPAALMIPNWNKAALTGATYVGPASGAHLNAMVLVHQQNANGLLQYAKEVSDPSSPNFRHFLTPQQIGERFGASQSDYQKAAAYFISQGLAVGGWPQHMLLSVAGDQSQFERAMGTKFSVYTKNGQQFIAPSGTPHFTKAVPVDGVGRIVTYNPMHSYLVPAPPRAGAAFGSGFSPSQVANAFDFTGAYQAGFDGTGITIGIIGTGPIDVGGTSGDKDLDALAGYTARANGARNAGCGHGERRRGGFERQRHSNRTAGNAEPERHAGAGSDWPWLPILERLPKPAAGDEPDVHR